MLACAIAFYMLARVALPPQSHAHAAQQEQAWMQQQVQVRMGTSPGSAALLGCGHLQMQPLPHPAPIARNFIVL